MTAGDKFWQGYLRLPPEIRHALAAEQAVPRLMEHREALDHHAEEFDAFMATGDEERWSTHLRHLGRTREAAGMAIAGAKHRWQSCEGTPKLADGCDCYACDVERLTVEGQREAAERPFGDKGATIDNSRQHERVGMQIHMTILLGATT